MMSAPLSISQMALMNEEAWTSDIDGSRKALPMECEEMGKTRNLMVTVELKRVLLFARLRL
jgi:hypothetical protein